MTRCTEQQIKKLLQNPLEETYSVDLANSTQKSTSLPKPHSTETKTQSSSRRQLIGQENTVKKDGNQRKMYNTLSPPAKATIPIVSKSNQMMPPPKTESKPVEKDTAIKRERIHKKPLSSARLMHEADNMLEQSNKENIPKKESAVKQATATVLSNGSKKAKLDSS